MTLQRVVVRADASATLGTGHVMRCIALAQELRRRGADVVFACTDLSPLPQRRLESEGLAVHLLEADTFAELLARHHPQWVVFDLGRRLPPGLDGACGRSALVIDDEGLAFARPPALVLNQNLHAPTTRYGGVDDADVLRGPRYLLFRDEFVAAAGQSRNPRTATGAPGHPRVLLTLGGADPDRLLPTFADALSRDPAYALDVIAPPAHPDLAALHGLADGRDVVVHEEVRDMPALLGRVDLAVSSGGTTVWELALLGIPTLVGSMRPMEERLLEGLERVGLFRSLGALAELTASRLTAAVRGALADRSWAQHAATLSREVVDGRGRERVVDEMIARSVQRA